MKGEISYDLIMDDNMPFVEGTYRLPNNQWQVFIFSKDPIQQREVKHGKWDSGVTGVFIRVPCSTRLSKHVVEQVMAEVIGVDEWEEVNGPDSMNLR